MNAVGVTYESGVEYRSGGVTRGRCIYREALRLSPPPPLLLLPFRALLGGVDYVVPHPENLNPSINQTIKMPAMAWHRQCGDILCNSSQHLSYGCSLCLCK